MNLSVDITELREMARIARQIDLAWERVFWRDMADKWGQPHLAEHGDRLLEDPVFDKR